MVFGVIEAVAGTLKSVKPFDASATGDASTEAPSCVMEFTYSVRGADAVPLVALRSSTVNLCGPLSQLPVTLTVLI